MSPLAYLVALGATLTLELVVAALYAGRARRRRVLATCVFVNLATHPLATLLAVHTGAFLLVEIAVVLLEAAAYRGVARLPWSRAARIALIGNVLSALVGVWYWT